MNFLGYQKFNQTQYFICMAEFKYTPKLANVIVTNEKGEDFGQPAKGTTDGDALHIKVFKATFVDKPASMIAELSLPIKTRNLRVFTEQDESIVETITFKNTAGTNIWMVNDTAVELTDYGVEMQKFDMGATFSVQYLLKSVEQIARITPEGTKEIISRKLVVVPGEAYFVDGPLESQQGEDFQLADLNPFEIDVTVKWNFSLRYVITGIDIISNTLSNGVYWKLRYGLTTITFVYYDGTRERTLKWNKALWPGVFHNFNLRIANGVATLSVDGKSYSSRNKKLTIANRTYNSNGVIVVGDTDTTITDAIFISGTDEKRNEQTLTVNIVGESTTFYSEEEWVE